jgi:hypothetical protein
MKAVVFTKASGTHLSAQAVFPIALSAILGGGLGLLAWSPGHTPALGVLFPLLWVTRRSRMTAFICAAAYHLAVVRFLPDFASNWFDSTIAGLACWLAVGVVSGVVWAVMWPRRSNSPCLVLSVCAVLVVLLLPPFGAVVPAHPVVAWGFLVPGSGWSGVGLMFFLTSIGACWLRSCASALHQRRRWLGVVLLSTLVWTGGVVPQPQDGISAGQVLAVQTQFGGFPEYGSLDVMERLVRMGEMMARQTHLGDQIKTVVFPEAIIGLYDRSLQPSIDLELVGPITSLGRTLVVGADIAAASKQFQNAAIILRPDGTSTTIVARQTVPIAQWRPWASGVTFPADWLAKSTADVGGGIHARFMFCHEEWMPALHLLSEAREEHEIVIAMGNLWAAQDETASYVQGSHTQGMALLFGRSYVRAVNGPVSKQAPAWQESS